MNMKAYSIAAALFLIHGVSWCQEWNSSLDHALEDANRSNKKVLLYFSVPEACDGCVALEKKVFGSEEFKVYAAANFILAKANFSDTENPEAMTDNLLIVEKYNKDGFFPLVVLMDKNAKVLGKTGAYNNEDASAYISLLKSLEN